MIFLKYFIFYIVVNGKRSVAAIKTYNNGFRVFNVKSYFVSMKINKVFDYIKYNFIMII